MDKFNEITHEPLRIYNRCVMASNINEDTGPGQVEEYFNLFSDKEKEDMLAMFKLLKKLGPKRTRELVKAGVEWTDQDYKVEYSER